MYSNNIVNFQESTTILNTCTKKSLETYRMPLVYNNSFNFKIPKYLLICIINHTEILMYLSLFVFVLLLNKDPVFLTYLLSQNRAKKLQDPLIIKGFINHLYSYVIFNIFQ